MNNQDAESSAPEIELDNRLIYIEPSDSNEKLPITRRAARLSIYLRDVLDLNDQQAFHDSPGKKSSNSRSILTDNCDSIVTIPLRNQSCCNLNTMKNIIRWCEYHCDDPKLITNNREDSIDEDDGGGATGAGSSVLGGVDQRRKVLDELPSYWDRRFLSDIVGDEDPNLGWSKLDSLLCYSCVSTQPGCTLKQVNWWIYSAISCPQPDDKCVKIIESRGADVRVTRDCLSNLISFRDDIPADHFEGCRPAAMNPKLAVFVDNSIDELDLKQNYFHNTTYCFCEFDHWCNASIRSISNQSILFTVLIITTLTLFLV
ncbi:UAF complex subunit Rrn10-like protein [Sarcoptes scabiei]|uniref:UAF complex subunit Rrn10-like protein n=1 Tax=Sarcoptes scabiei TaxID=52283 RepID=A0A132A0U6_SARSC|nr:UAF complex subunit Rrn10-like protein [Sarcoptes scabiei]